MSCTERVPQRQSPSKFSWVYLAMSSNSCLGISCSTTKALWLVATVEPFCQNLERDATMDHSFQRFIFSHLLTLGISSDVWYYRKCQRYTDWSAESCLPTSCEDGRPKRCCLPWRNSKTNTSGVFAAIVCQKGHPKRCLLQNRLIESKLYHFEVVLSLDWCLSMFQVQMVSFSSNIYQTYTSARFSFMGDTNCDRLRNHGALSALPFWKCLCRCTVNGFDCP